MVGNVCVLKVKRVLPLPSTLPLPLSVVLILPLSLKFRFKVPHPLMYDKLFVEDVVAVVVANSMLLSV